MTIIFRGTRTPSGCVITANGETLQDHNGGFGWGDIGSDANRTALALLDHALGPRRALLNYLLFRRMVVSNLKQDQWQLSSEQIEALVNTIECGGFHD